jgi:CDP-diacylglycerol--glycerol-3-phosphate 3-phosphatidyltransferase
MANVPNLLTGLRLALVPIFLYFLFAGDGHENGSRITAFVIFAVAVITDRLDGSLARSYGVTSEFGKLADPIADKMLVGSALIGLSLRFAVISRGVIPASRGGKLKTLVQAIAIGLFILPLNNWPPVWSTVAWAVMWVAIVLTVVTGIDYVLSARRGNNPGS